MDHYTEIKIPVGKPNRNRKLDEVFGTDPNGGTRLPAKVSNVKISRIFNAEKRGGCTLCFPHGFETTNATVNKNKRNWKSQRRNQWAG